MGGETKWMVRRQPGQTFTPSFLAKGAPQKAQRGGKIRSINPLRIPTIALAFDNPLTPILLFDPVLMKYSVIKGTKSEQSP
jgi:hypothetical protein